MRTADEIAIELETFYRRYIEVFNRQDTYQFVQCFAHPYAAVSGDRGLLSIANDDEHRKSFLRGMTALKQRGWARSGINSIKAWALADNLGMIVSEVTRYKADDSVIETVRACYILCRDHAAWKIVTLSEIKPPFRGPGDVPHPSSITS
jgi:hypothetical protein